MLYISHKKEILSSTGTELLKIMDCPFLHKVHRCHYMNINWH